MVSGVTLQAAYDGGNEIQAEQPVVVKSNPGDGYTGSRSIENMLEDALMVASGHAATPGLEPYTAMGPGFVGLHGSGVGGGSYTVESLKIPLFGQGTIVGVDGNLLHVVTGSTMLWSQNNGEASIGMHNGAINLSAYSGSGQLEYRFGTHESWQVKDNANGSAGPMGDGWLPIPHSGQIEQMVNEAVLRAIKQHKKSCHVDASGVVNC